jgi:hypothetical protein
VFAEEIALQIIEAAGMELLFVEVRTEKRLVVVSRDETDFLSALSATLRPNERAISRIAGFDIPPSGVRARRNCGWRRLNMK